MKYVPIERLNQTDLIMYQCGTELCVPDHDYGPAVRDHYLIHYILDGKGIYQVGDKIYELKKNQGFLICPGAITYYKADFQDPWNYSWVGFHGLKAEPYLRAAGLTAESPIFTYEKDEFISNCFKNMIATKTMKRGRELRLQGHLYMFLTQLMEENFSDKFVDSDETLKESYVRMAMEYIQMNYSRKVKVSDIAGYIRLDRSYLGSIFKEYMNISLRDYTINYRLEKARELMSRSNLSIGDIARSVGYEDQLQFSKIFKKVYGTCPREYRKTLRDF